MNGRVMESERKPRQYLSRASAQHGLLSFAEAQEQLQCGRTKIYALGRAGKLDLVKFDTRTMVTEKSLQKLLNEIHPLTPNE